MAVFGIGPTRLLSYWATGLTLVPTLIKLPAIPVRVPDNLC